MQMKSECQLQIPDRNYFLISQTYLIFFFLFDDLWVKQCIPY